MKCLSKIFTLCWVFFTLSSAVSAQKSPLLIMDSVKVACQGPVTKKVPIVTVFLRPNTYWSTNIVYSIAGNPSLTLDQNTPGANMAGNPQTFPAPTLINGNTYTITANAPGVGGNTLSFKPDCGGIVVGPGPVIELPNVIEKGNCPSPVNLVANGNFIYGNDGSFQSDLLLGCNKCVANSYCVGSQFTNKCSSWPANSFDHTIGTASGSYLLVDGNPSQPSTVWSDTVTVCKDIEYTFSFWVKSIYAEAFTLGMMIRDKNVPASTVTVSQTKPTWTQYSFKWLSAASESIPIGIKQLTAGQKRDFGIDDIFFGFCCECNAPVSIEEDCVVDIDTTIVKVSCGNIVDIKSIFDGTPSIIKYTIYDSVGQVVFTTSNTAQFTFTLPGPGIFYGVTEVSCGGGDEQGGDEDEDVFEIINLPPVADFRLNSAFSCVNGKAQRTVSTLDYSNEEGSLSYSYVVTEKSSGAVMTYNAAEPTMVLDAKKAYSVVLTVTDTKGCSAQKMADIDTAATCKSKFDWWYSWCDDSCVGTKNITVNFENKSEFTNCAVTPVYTWDYGDGKSATGDNPPHVYSVPCAGKSFNVKLTMTFGKPGDPNYCQAVWDTMITVDPAKVKVGVSKICCDGLVFFYTNATKGKWSTPGSLGIPKWPAVSKKIWKPLGIQVGQNYRQYYSTPGTYYVMINGGETENHNRCPIREIPFTITSVECFNRNVKAKATDVVDGVTVKYKFTALALPLVHRMKSKIRAKGGKKLAEISTDFSGSINKKGADGCFCTPQPVGKSSGTLTNKRKAKAAVSTNGKFRIGMNKATANFYVKTNSGTTKTWQLSLGFPPCDYPWFLFF